MAINIFSGGGGRSKVNSASNSTRAQAAKSALTGPAETSSSGSTAVKTSGTLAKVGNTVGKLAGLASKFIPGVGGSVAKGISSLFNDPEWWQQVPGDAVTLNSPLRPILVGPVTNPDPNGTTADLYTIRAAVGEFVSTHTTEDSVTGYVFEPTQQAVTQYLMPQIRKVVNAIPLQTAEAYQRVIRVNATIYALWRQLKKFDYMLKHGQTYLANMNDPMFPLLQVENAAYLQSTINRLEEYLRANVRLPHTLCEYLAWRFGRVYKSNDSAKAGLIMYDVVAARVAISVLSTYISSLMDEIAQQPAFQQANTDLYNAYFEHDLLVEIRDDTQFSYDCKEFMLRTNCDFGVGAVSNSPLNNIYIDSRLDNPTTFMASTVSTIGVADDGSRSWLFPVTGILMWIPRDIIPRYITVCYEAESSIMTPSASTNWDGGSIWTYFTLRDESQFMANVLDYNVILPQVVLAKALDIYNKDQLLLLGGRNDPSSQNFDRLFYVDLTSLSMDMGQVDERVLGIEHVYAFANLVDIDRKHSMSYAKAEKLVAKDTADLIEKLDVATVADQPKKTV